MRPRGIRSVHPEDPPKAINVARRIALRVVGRRIVDLQRNGVSEHCSNHAEYKYGRALAAATLLLGNPALIWRYRPTKRVGSTEAVRL